MAGMAISGAQVGGLTRKRFPGLNYEDLVRIDAKNLPNLYAAAQAKEESDITLANTQKDLQLTADRLAIEKANLDSSRDIAQQQIDAASSQASVSNITGAAGLLLNAYGAYKTSKVLDKLGATVTPSGTVVEPGYLDKAGTYIKENIFEPIGKGATNTAEYLGLKKKPDILTETPAEGTITPDVTLNAEKVVTQPVTPDISTNGIKASTETTLNTPVPGELEGSKTAIEATVPSDQLGYGLTGKIPTLGEVSVPVEETITPALTIDAEGTAITAGAPEVVEFGTLSTEASGLSTMGEGTIPGQLEVGTSAAGGLGAATTAGIVAIVAQQSVALGNRIMEKNPENTAEYQTGQFLSAPLSGTATDPIGSTFERAADAMGMNKSNDAYRALTTMEIQERQAYSGINKLLSGDFEGAGEDIRASLTPAPIAKAVGKGWLCIAIAMYFGMNQNELRLTHLISVYSVKKYGDTFSFYLQNGYRLIRRIKDSGVNLREFFGQVKSDLVDKSIEYVNDNEMDKAALNYWEVTRKLFERFMPELSIPVPIMYLRPKV